MVGGAGLGGFVWGWVGGKEHRALVSGRIPASPTLPFQKALLTSMAKFTKMKNDEEAKGS